MSEQTIKTSQQGVFFESIDPPEYYMSSMTAFDPATGKINVAWWENDQANNNIYEELAANVNLVKFDQYPVAMAVNDAGGGKIGFYFATKDPSTWKVGTVVAEDNVNHTVSLALYNEANPSVPTVVTAPAAEMHIDVAAPFFMPNPLFGTDDVVATFMANN